MSLDPPLFHRVPRETDRPWSPASEAAQCLRARIQIPTLPDHVLRFVAYGNECPVYGAAARAEIDRRNLLDPPGPSDLWAR